MDISSFFQTNNWSVVETLTLPARNGETFTVDDLPLSRASVQFLRRAYPKGLYRHQKEAINQFIEGNDVCITTTTASGKSLTFYVAAIEQMHHHSSSKVAAIYPLKALGKEQEERWNSAIHQAGLERNVGRIDGQTSSVLRAKMLRNSDVLILTPDIIHAWLLSNLSDDRVIRFLRSLSLIVVDEVHNYSGVFGSNAAFLFRRIQHLANLLGARPRFFCASATIARPEEHLRKLIGKDFVVISSDMDTSPKRPIEIILVKPPRSADLLTEVTQLLHFLSSQEQLRFLAFVDSRKQTEQMASILARRHDKDRDEDIDTVDVDHKMQLDVLPYRAGYEEQDRSAIQQRLAKGTLRGVVSTSALELGIDIPHLNTGVLVGVPQSLTSLHQRIGRVGRTSKGTVIVINTGDVYDEAVFAEPRRFLERPLAEGALYLENSRIQYIHALCLARIGGENDQVCASISRNTTEFYSEVDWPQGFIELCKRERIGEIPPDLQAMKAEAGDTPNSVYPLRDVESQFSVELRQGRIPEPLGSLSYSQLMREAYPGAVYYYITNPYRVIQVNLRERKVLVRKERKRYTTRPIFRPAMIFPNITSDNVYAARKHGHLIVMECSLQVRETICGFKERRGPNELSFAYPLPTNNELGVSFRRDAFTRVFFTTGVVITHPAFSREGFNLEAFAQLLYEVFLLQVAFERRDIDVATDKHRKEIGVIHKDDRFVAIYDRTYGSLRLSARIMEANTLQHTLRQLTELLSTQQICSLDTESMSAVEEIYRDSLQEPTILDFAAEDSLGPESADQRTERVIMPGSKGISIRHGNEEFYVEDVFYSPKMQALAYRGRHQSTPPNVSDTMRVTDIIEIPGVSQMGSYNYETGELITQTTA